MATLAAAVAATPAAAYDWLQFNGDAAHSGNNSAERILGVGNVASLTQKFQVTLPNTADGAPVLLQAVTTAGGVRDVLYLTTTDGVIVALDAHTGTTVWSQATGPNGCTDSNGSTCYTTASPALDPNRLYVYSYGLDGKVHKYQVGDGSEILSGGWPQ
ncbi:MAG TPA: PQQ-binding-like beta-propeller repeat protein, partial [Casimicrobiaceae bacterium]|nr:PQQ-binding-like beta-propeller repeat protein [Casimicrobiaceae bacterium]